jgi:hypothetical protein
MAYHYSHPRRESDPHALPDLEVWRDRIAEVTCDCGTYDVPMEQAREMTHCPSCEEEIDADAIEYTQKEAWFYWFCFPGCLPEGSVNGPYATEDAALAAARDGVDDYEDA